MMQFGGRKKTKPVTTVVPEPSYNIPIVLGGETMLCTYIRLSL